MMERTRFFMVLLWIPLSLSAQQVDSTSHINKKRLWIVTGAAGVGYTSAMIGLNELWYKNAPKQSFKFFNDDAEWKQVDKIGHFYSAFYVSHGMSRAMRWSNADQKKSALVGALTGFAVMAPIEIFDGYSSAYGASVGDLLADAGGSVFFLAQSLAWKEPRLYPKFSWHHTSYAAVRPNVLGDNWSSQLLKDYNGQTYWISVDMDKFVTFPKWLNLAAGYGAQGMIYARDDQNAMNGYHAHRQYYLSIDFDFTAIKTKSKFVKTLIFIVNMIKLPAPAIEFSKKGVRGHALYF
jgi:hypothetical protein